MDENIHNLLVDSTFRSENEKPLRRKISLKCIEGQNDNHVVPPDPCLRLKDKKSPYHKIDFKCVKDALDINEILSERRNVTEILDLLCTRSRDQRLELVSSYKSTFEESLVDHFLRTYKKKGSSKSLVELLTDDYDNLYLSLLFSAINNKKNSLVWLLLILTSKNDWKKLTITYRTKYNKDLVDDIKKRFYGDYRNLFVNYLEETYTKNSERFNPNTEAQKFTVNFKKKGTENMNTLFSVYNREEIKHILIEFKSITEKDIFEVYRDLIKVDIAHLYKAFGSYLSIKKSGSLF